MSADPQPGLMEAMLAVATKFLPGFIASLVSLKFLPRESTWGERAYAFVGGMLLAIYVAPAIAEVLDVTSLRQVVAIGVATAMFGILAATELASAIRESKPILLDAMRRWFRVDKG